MNLNATLIIQVISFLILLWFMAKVLYKPLLDFLDKRAEYVKSILDEAKENQEKSQKNLDVSQRQLEEVKEEILRLKEEADLQADERREDILKEAKKEAEHILMRAKDDIEKQTREVKDQIKKEIAILSVSIAEKIINKEIDNERHEALVKDFLKEIKAK